MGVPEWKVRSLRKMAWTPVSLQAKVGDDEDACMGDFVEDTTAVDPANASCSNTATGLLTAIAARSRRWGGC